MRRRAQPLLVRIVNHPVLAGVVVIAIMTTAVVISYSAQNGVPFLPTYDVSVAIPDAAQLTKNSDVRIGGARVGQVLAIEAVPPARGHGPYARLKLALEPSAGPLPRDTAVQLRVSSILGGKYVQLTPGHARERVPSGGSLPLRNAKPIVDLDQAFRVFDVPTRRDLSRVIISFADGLAGRGVAINDVIGSTRTLVDPLERVLRALADPGTNLARLIRGAAATTGALAPVAPALTALMADGARTFSALEAAGGSLGQTIDALPPTEVQATGTLRRIRPVLADAASIARALRPGAALLPRATADLDVLLRTAEPVLRRVPRVAPTLNRTFDAVDAFAAEPAALAAFRTLGVNDLATFGASAFVGLGAILRSAAAAQIDCNAIGLWARNLSSSFTEGDAAGTWIRMIMVNDPAQTFQSATAASDLHFNPYPHENSHECEAGNEPFLGGQRIGNPSGNQSRNVDITHRPALVGGRG